MAKIQDFMTPEQADAYGMAVSLAAAREPDRAAWVAGVTALDAAKKQAVQQYKGSVKTNRHGQPAGGVHPALADLSGIFDLSGCYAPA
jgi:hypothetical protein